MKKKSFIISASIIFSFNLLATPYELSIIPVGAQISGIGGFYTTLSHSSEAVFLNPAGTFGSKEKYTLSAKNYVLDISLFSLSYIVNAKNFSCGTGIKICNLGEIIEMDENADTLGKTLPFSAEIAFNYSQKLSPLFTTGANFKIFYEKLARHYYGAAIAIDAGILYTLPKIILGAYIKNLGLTVKKFYQQRENLPLCLCVGAEYEYSNFTHIIANLISYDKLYFTIGLKSHLSPAFSVWIGYSSFLSDLREAELPFSGISAGIQAHTEKGKLGYSVANWGNFGWMHDISISF